MDTKVYYIYDEKNKCVIDEASNLIKSGKTVVFPTETVYGLGANALDEAACDKIFLAKGRPQDNPLIIHVGNKDISKYVKKVPDIAKKLMDNFWPGPLTIILEKDPIIPSKVTGGLSNVAIRMPENEIAMALINEAGVPIAAPSANLSGKPSPTTIEHCIKDLSGRVDMIIGGEECEFGLESTVVEVGEEFVTILRPGAITKSMMESISIPVKIDPTIMESLKDVAPKAPGMKYRHYAPDGDMTLVVGETDRVVEYINEKTESLINEGKTVGVIATDETKDRYKGNNILSLGKRENLMEIASNVFDVLREFDKIKVDYIFSEAFEQEEIGLAIMNRLKKAASHRVVKL